MCGGCNYFRAQLQDGWGAYPLRGEVVGRVTMRAPAAMSGRSFSRGCRNDGGADQQAADGEGGPPRP